MSAGLPDYNRLLALGRLPDALRERIPGLREADTAKKEIARIKRLLCDECRAKVEPKA